MNVNDDRIATIIVPIAIELGIGMSPNTAIIKSLSALSPRPIPFKSIPSDSAFALE